jgi:phage repressor protein C with HTH and peptisase S24 domain
MDTYLLSPDAAKTQALQLRADQSARIRARRDARELTRERLADLCGMHYNTLALIERSKQEASLEQLATLARALKTDFVDLAYGLHNAAAEGSSGSQPFEDFELIEHVDARASAGQGTVNTSAEIIGKFAYKRSWLKAKGYDAKSLRIITATGDSMASRINHGDILLCNFNVNSFGDDGVYIIEMGDSTFVKLLQKDFATGGLAVLSYNPAYKLQKLSPERASELHISAKVVWHGGEL